MFIGHFCSESEVILITDRAEPASSTVQYLLLYNVADVSTACGLVASAQTSSASSVMVKPMKETNY